MTLILRFTCVTVRARCLLTTRVVFCLVVSNYILSLKPNVLYAEQKEWLHTFYLSERACGLDMLKLFLLKELHLNRKFHLNHNRKRHKSSTCKCRKTNPALPPKDRICRNDKCGKPITLEALIPIFINREFLKGGEDNFLKKLFRLWYRAFITFAPVFCIYVETSSAIDSPIVTSSRYSPL